MKREISIKKSGVHAFGIFDDESQTVLILKGSEMTLVETPSLQANYRKLRKELIDKGFVILNATKDKYIFDNNYEFNKPSVAVTCITGVSEALDGLIDKQTGLNLQQLKEQKSSSPNWDFTSSVLSKQDYLTLIKDTSIFTKERLKALFKLMPFQQTGISIVKLGTIDGVPRTYSGNLVALAQAIDLHKQLNYLNNSTDNVKPYTLICKGYYPTFEPNVYYWGIKDPLFEALNETFSKTEIQQILNDKSHLNEENSDSSFENFNEPMLPLNVILYGPPGTGKTYMSTAYALAMMEGIPINVINKIYPNRQTLVNRFNQAKQSKNIAWTTFHQSYGYEDFIEGLKPILQQTTLNFDIKNGIFKSIAEEALSRPKEKFVIIIDEINRGNISRIFGELITLIEPDKRLGLLNELSVTLPTSQKPFGVPANLYILGTMNTADKSISMVDSALRRRFTFIEISINPNLILDTYVRQVFNLINEGIETQNANLKDLLIGHAYFMGATKSTLETILNQQVIPLLYEYFYDNVSKVEAVLTSLQAHQIIIQRQPYQRLTVKVI